MELKYKKIEQVYNNFSFMPTPSQDMFLKEFTTSDGHYCLLGEAGSGKSTIMQMLRDFLSNMWCNSNN